jgi:hypothetical protein
LRTAFEFGETGEEEVPGGRGRTDEIGQLVALGCRDGFGGDEGGDELVLFCRVGRVWALVELGTWSARLAWDATGKRNTQITNAITPGDDSTGLIDVHVNITVDDFEPVDDLFDINVADSGSFVGIGLSSSEVEVEVDT